MEQLQREEKWKSGENTLGFMATLQFVADPFNLKVQKPTLRGDFTCEFFVILH